jgi:hypothetical protein
LRLKNLCDYGFSFPIPFKVEEASYNRSQSLTIQNTGQVPQKLVFHIDELSNTLHCASKCIIPDQDLIEAQLPHRNLHSQQLARWR